MSFETALYEFASPTLLAQQPAEIPDKKTPRRDPNWDTIFKHLESRLTGLRSWRYSWWAFWSVLAAYFLPFRYVWLVTANKMWRGGNLNDQIINSHGVLAVRTCAAGLWTGLCSPSRPWFKLGVLGSAMEKLDAAGKTWLKDTEQLIYAVFAGSNFYSEMAQCFRDETVFGTACPIILEDHLDVIRLYLPAAGEYYLTMDGRMDTNTIFREFTMTVHEMVSFFTVEALPTMVQRDWTAGSYEKEYVAAHAIEANFDLPKRAGGKINVVPQSFPYRDVYWIRDSKSEKAISIKGFNSRPFMAFKWAKVSNDAYGRSPCMDAIGDNTQLQEEDTRKGEYIEKGIRPPMRAAPELKNEPASIMPSMITYTAAKDGFSPLFEVQPAWLKALTDDITKVEGRIDHALYVDLFMAITRMEGVQPRNELELTKRDLERLQELGPVIELAEKELDIAIHRTLEILDRRRMLAPKPPSLQNVQFKVNYVSILRLAQLSAQSVSMKDCFETGGRLSAAAKASGVPDPLRIINLDKALARYCEINNFESDLLFTDDEVAEHDRIRTQEQQKAQTPQNMMAAVQAAKTLSETQVPGGGGGGANSALGALLGGPPAGNA